MIKGNLSATRTKQNRMVLASAIFLPLSLWILLSSRMSPVNSLEDELGSIDDIETNRVSNGVSASLRANDATEEAASESSDSGNRGEKPLFVLHVGPSKTGTTTVQYFAKSNLELLENANLYYLGHDGHTPSRDTHRLHTYCLSDNNYKPDECKQRWEEIQKNIDEHHSKNHMVLLSEERFSYPRDEEAEEKYLWKYLVPLKEKWDVRVVYTYRRYYEWLPSKYYQVFNPKGGSRYASNLAKRLEWPDMKGKVIPSFPEYFEAYSNKWQAKHPASMKKKFQERFDNMVYFNMHQEGDFLPRFFCEMIPEAASLCKHLKTEYESIVKNPSTSKHVHYDMIAVEAYKRGWVNKELPRQDVAQAVEDYANELGFTKMTDFPLDCLTPEQLESLLDQSLALEEESVPEFFKLQGEKALRDGFVESVEKKKFCTVDVQAVLEQPKWEKFFKNMTKDNISVKPDE